MRPLAVGALHLFVLLGSVRPVSAQVIEAAGSRAPGMGGAFVAVANDSSAGWWNPAGLAAGPFMDLALARNISHISGGSPEQRVRAASFALGTPVVGVSYYRFRVTDIGTTGSTAERVQDREEGRASQFGATLVQTLVPGVHAGATLKYVSTDGDGDFDADVGVLAAAGGVRVGFVARNLTESLPRQARVGVAFLGEDAGTVPVTVAIDADLRRYPGFGGDRRVVAVGAEQWFRARRFAVRGGARFNTVGRQERAATGGASVAVRSGLYIDGHAVIGGAGDERGWGVAARVSF
jgi:hypothetical protein